MVDIKIRIRGARVGRYSDEMGDNLTALHFGTGRTVAEVGPEWL